MLRISLSIGAVLVSLLFPSGRAIAARAIYAYLSPCEALGVGCPEGSAAPAQTQTPPVADGGGGGGGAGSGPVYIPQVEPLPVPEPFYSAPQPEIFAPIPVPAPYAPYMPEIPLATPIHAAARPDDRPVGRAPLHPAGVPTGVSLGLLSLLALTATVLPAFRRKYV